MSVLSTSHYPKPYVAGPTRDRRVEFIEQPEKRNRAARGAITGVLLGAGLWGMILVLAGVIKL